MPSFGKRSLENLQGVHPKIVDVLKTAIQHYNFSVLEGVRTLDRQEFLVNQGVSTTLKSKHLIQTDGYAHAVDIAPYPIDWDNVEEFFYLAGLIEGIASTVGIRLRWGGRWKTLKDCPHFELRKRT